MTEKPPWRVAIEQFERSIGAPLEEYIKTDDFADMAARAAKGQAQIQQEIGTGTSQWLHAMGLPTATDIAELRAEIAELRKEVRSLARGARPGQEGPGQDGPGWRGRPDGPGSGTDGQARTGQAKKPANKAGRQEGVGQEGSGKAGHSSARPAAKRTQTARGRAKPE